MTDPLDLDRQRERLQREWIHERGEHQTQLDWVAWAVQRIASLEAIVQAQTELEAVLHLQPGIQAQRLAAAEERVRQLEDEAQQYDARWMRTMEVEVGLRETSEERVRQLEAERATLAREVDRVRDMLDEARGGATIIECVGCALLAIENEVGGWTAYLRQGEWRCPQCEGEARAALTPAAEIAHLLVEHYGDDAVLTDAERESLGLTPATEEPR